MNQRKDPTMPVGKSAIQLAFEKANSQEPRKEPEKVVELRNPKEIARGIQYTEAELEVHLQLGVDSESKRLLLESVLELMKNIGLGKTGGDIQKKIDEVIGTVDELDKAATAIIECARVEASEAYAELEALQAQGGGARPNAVQVVSQAVTMKEIDAELERRKNAGATVGKLSENLQDEIEAMKTELEILRLKVQGGDKSAATKARKETLERKIETDTAAFEAIIERADLNNRNVGMLKAYQKAVKIVEDGVPEGIIGEEFFERKKK